MTVALTGSSLAPLPPAVMASTVEKALTDLALRGTGSGDKPLHDDGGLYALPGTNGRHGWCLDYRMHDTYKAISLGT